MHAAQNILAATALRAAYTLSALGPLAVVLDEQDRLIAIQHGDTALTHAPRNAATSNPVRHAMEAVEAYLDGHPEKLETLPHHFARGTELQKATWRALRKVPRGETITYMQLATRLGRPDAVRAIGSACGQNPLPLLYPCHRIIGSNGSLTGFAWGLDAKRNILLLELALA